MQKNIFNRQGLNRYFFNTSWVFFEKTTRAIFVLLTTIWLARYLGPDRFGQLNYAYSFVMLFAPIASFGIDNILIRELVKRAREFDVLLGTSILLKFAGGVAVIVIINTLLLITNIYVGDNNLVIIISLLLFFQSFNVIEIFYQSKVLSKYVAISNSVAFLISSIIKIIFIIIEAPLVYFAYSFVIDVVFYACGLIILYKKQQLLSLFKWKFKKNIAMELLQNSWPLIFSGIVASMYMRIDQVMIGNMIDKEAVGQYAAAVRISEAGFLMPLVITTSIFPAIINAKKINNDLYYRRLQKLFDMLFLLSIIFTLPIVVFNTWIINVLYGDQYNEAGDALVILAISSMFVFSGYAASKWVVAENLFKNALLRTTTGALINIILNYLLINRYGMYGAAISTLVSYFYVNFFSLFIFKKTRICFSMQARAFNIFRKGYFNVFAK